MKKISLILLALVLTVAVSCAFAERTLTWNEVNGETYGATVAAHAFAEKLEEISKSFPGIASSYAIQAGREIRIMVKPEAVSEDQMVLLARDIAKKIEAELTYPGQVKVHVLRETKVVDYAK